MAHGSTLTPALTFTQLQQGIAVAVLVVMYAWRVMLNRGDDARMDEKTNPANHIVHILPRWLTKSHYTALHTGLLLYPRDLACDWSSGAIDPVLSLADSRNIYSAAMYLSLVRGLSW